ncbi:hypothetical protein [Polycladidibacter stylochi]|uniref:hypothetical protein n=1 Tax=Polycladidibacter stylochi TaxID=1807766 RepID=UPI0008321162|nr:hypothetical protein [Pseudovibrio stylochi]
MNKNGATDIQQSTANKILVIAPGNHHLRDRWGWRTSAQTIFHIAQSSEAVKAAFSAHNVLPKAVILTWRTVNPPETIEYIQLIKQFRRISQIEIPFIIFASQNAIIPPDLKPHSVFCEPVPIQTLLDEVEHLQRFIIRAEEAKVRRKLFGPLLTERTTHDQSRAILLYGHHQKAQLIQNITGRKIIEFGNNEDLFAIPADDKQKIDAVVIDCPEWSTVNIIPQIPNIFRTQRLPIIAICHDIDETERLYSSGASAVLFKGTTTSAFRSHLNVILRSQRRSRISDAMLQRSSQWLSRSDNSGVVSKRVFDLYMNGLKRSTKRRGETINQLNLLELIERFTNCKLSQLTNNGDHLTGTVLSIAMAVCRDEDFVANVEGYGPVAVLRSKQGLDELSSRILLMVQTTGLGNG